MSPDIKKAPNIFLTGFMGSGKTTIGKEVARHLGFEYLDIDEIIEQLTGKSIAEIFQQDGEQFFRMLEKQVLNDCIQKNNIVVSLGGGTLIDPHNVTAVKQNGILIHLSAEPEEIWERIETTNKRPLLQKLDGTLVPDHEALEHIVKLLSIRQKGYNLADTAIPTDNKNQDEVLTIILNYISTIG